SATTRSSSRRSGLGTTRGVDGEASIITPRCASRLTGFWSPSGPRFPPQDPAPPCRSRHLRYPKLIDPAVPPLRPERHVPNSIATMRARLIEALIEHLPRCPCCGADNAQHRRKRL